MMEPESTSSHIDSQPVHKKFAPNLIGAIMVAAGFVILLDQYLRTEWLSLTIVPAAGLMLLATGLNSRKMGWIIPGLIVGSIGVGGVLFFGNFMENQPLIIRIGWLLFSISAGFALILFFSLLYGKSQAWWAFLIACILAGVAYPFLLNTITVFVFFTSICLTTGFAFLAWGFFSRLFGLLIPGSLLVSLGLGFYLGFISNMENNELVQVGILLTCFGLGWALITLTSRMIIPKFIWWPLIPGGILAVVGWGLTIGGNRGSALTLIGNTGSIALIIMGLYLILLRRGIRK
jgi:hypothetical protein